MSGVFDGLRVLDLSTGVAGPMAAMRLADQGAGVTKIEPPGGDPTRRPSGSRVWHRGKRSAVIGVPEDERRATLSGNAARVWNLEP
jgi:crotonobetainyl-CoA:carnitine CoA-transferase CaiB-like acyl-CoA transferase